MKKEATYFFVEKIILLVFVPLSLYDFGINLIINFK